jgi:hypothetical protein
MRTWDVKNTAAIQSGVLNFINVSDLSKMQLLLRICGVDSHLRLLRSVNVGSVEENGKCFLVTEINILF